MTPEDGDPPTTPYPPYAEDATTLAGKSDVVAGAIAADDVTSVSGVYALGEVIGAGGMGEVLVAHDRRIGRDVALKRLHAAAPSETDVRRFLREARIQARLEHPAIVPVYEVARDEVGRAFFTMKRVVGTTLVNPDFAAFARSFGAHGETVNTTDEFRPAFERALAAGKPSVIELKIDPEAITPRQSLSEIRASSSKG